MTPSSILHVPSKQSLEQTVFLLLRDRDDTHRQMLEDNRHHPVTVSDTVHVHACVCVFMFVCVCVRVFLFMYMCIMCSCVSMLLCMYVHDACMNTHV